MKLIHQVIKIRSIRTSPSLINKLNNMETDYTIADYEAIKFLINYVDNIEDAYMHCLGSITQRNKEFKEAFVAFLKTYKQNNNK